MCPLSWRYLQAESSLADAYLLGGGNARQKLYNIRNDQPVASMIFRQVRQMANARVFFRDGEISSAFPSGPEDEGT